MDALRRVYEKYKPALLSVAAALLNDPAAVEDVLRDVFVRFASQAGRFRLSGSLKGYLAICVANRARNVNREGRHTATGRLDEVESGPSSDAGSCEAAGQTEQRLVVARALAQLPDEQRQAVVMHVLGAMRFRQIAHQTGESANTIASRYRYGLAKLQSLLNGEVEL